MTEGSTSSQTDFSMASEFAVRVALQTVKERCVSLHQRLQLLEEENQMLRNNQADSHEMRNATTLLKADSEADRLKQKVSQLTSQNQRLNEHIQIISKENNQLWSRLSQMSKDRHSNSTDSISSPRKQSDKESNLIRSRTFTQHSPNPNLRHTIVPFESIDGESTEDLTEEQITSHISSLQEMKDIAFTQQRELKSSLQLLQYKILNQKCPKCTNKPETVEENIQTSILPSLLPKPDHPESTRSTATDTKDHIDILAEKRAADEHDRVCPLCGQIFSTAVPFEDFVRHVELHFIDDDAGSESDISLENNYEFVSNTIGNF